MIEFFRSEQDRGLRVIPPEEYSAEGFDVKDCWINLVDPSDKEVNLVSTRSEERRVGKEC